MRVIAVCLVLLAGCGGSRDFSDLEVFMQDVRTRQEVRSEPLQPLAQATPSTYRADERRSPFQPPATVRPVEQHRGTTPVRPNFHRPRQYLERYPIDRISMVGTLSRGAAHYGLLEDGDGIVHRVSVGDYLGEDHGRIRAIGPSMIDLIEIVPDGAGGWMERARAVSLRLPGSEPAPTLATQASGPTSEGRGSAESGAEEPGSTTGQPQYVGTHRAGDPAVGRRRLAGTKHQRAGDR